MIKELIFLMVAEKDWETESKLLNNKMTIFLRLLTIFAFSDKLGQSVLKNSIWEGKALFINQSALQTDICVYWTNA